MINLSSSDGSGAGSEMDRRHDDILEVMDEDRGFPGVEAVE